VNITAHPIIWTVIGTALALGLIAGVMARNGDNVAPMTAQPTPSVESVFIAEDTETFGSQLATTASAAPTNPAIPTHAPGAEQVTPSADDPADDDRDSKEDGDGDRRGESDGSIEREGRDSKRSDTREPGNSDGRPSSRNNSGPSIIGQLEPEEPEGDPIRTPTGNFAIGALPSGATNGHSASNDIKAGKGCSVQCITSGVAHAHGVGAKLTVATDSPATIWIAVWSDNGYHKMVNSGPGKTMSFSHIFDDLDPSTTYQAMAAAEDSDGYTSHAWGEFDTLNRHVEINFNGAHILAKPHGTNHFLAFFRMNGAWEGDHYQYTFGDKKDWFYDESWLPLGFWSFTLNNVDQHLDLIVRLAQNDSGSSICEGIDVKEVQAWSGSGGCYTWATAKLAGGDTNLDAGLSDIEPGTEHTLHRILQLPSGGALPSGYGEPLNFTVPVSLTVYYE
jgi:hypothetical protein